MKGTRNVKVSSHILYVDDIILFYREYFISITIIDKVLIRYSECSGQICNASKSIIYVGAMSKARHEHLVEILVLIMRDLHFQYLRGSYLQKET